MINLTSEWRKMGFELNGDRVDFEGRPLSKAEYLKLLPYMKVDITTEETCTLIDLSSEFIPSAIRNIEGIQIDGKPADPVELCKLGAGVALIPHIVRELVGASMIKGEDEKNSDGQSTT